MKIKHSEIEVLRANPKAFLKRISTGSPPFGPHSALRLSMMHLHKQGDDLLAATDYLKNMFKGRGARFTEASLAEQLGRLESYYGSYQGCAGRACDVQCRLNGITPDGNEIAGEVARIDIAVEVASGVPYYYAWLFESKASGWENELRMPLIQFAVAQDLRCPVEEVAVGVYCHETITHKWSMYSNGYVATALDELDNLVRLAES